MAWWDYEDGGDQSITQPTDNGNVGNINQGDWMYDNTPSDYTGYTPGYTNPNLATEAVPDYGDTSYYGGINTGEVQTDTTPTWNAPNAGGIQQALAGIFSGAQNNPLVGKGISALFEGYQNKKKQAAMNSIASNPALDPFGSQRGFYQQQAQQTVTNPYDSPIVKAQITQLQNAQNIKDAAAGRRSNSLTSSPAVMAEMAKIAQQYQAQMAQQGGANFAPNGSAIAQAQTGGVNSGVNGYISPLLTALGWNNQSNQNKQALQ
jgi:hypothetical protein